MLYLNIQSLYNLKTYLVAISLISEDQTIPQVVENAAKKQCLFAIVVNSQNEVHQSLTVNILHGTPQGMSLDCTSFE
jgi:hypothetical protein